MSLSLRCKRLVDRELQDLAIRFSNIACSEFMCLIRKHRAGRCGKIRASLRSDEYAALLANFHENRMPPSLIGILYCQERCLTRCPSRGRRAARHETTATSSSGRACRRVHSFPPMAVDALEGSSLEISVVLEYTPSLQSLLCCKAAY